MWSLLDAEQEIPWKDQPLVYYQKYIHCCCFLLLWPVAVACCYGLVYLTAGVAHCWCCSLLVLPGIGFTFKSISRSSTL